MTPAAQLAFLDLQNPAAPPATADTLLALGVSLGLNLFIAAVYRATYRGTRYSQDYVQTLILIGVVTTILISVVNGNGPIAFGMFAAFSVIRFRRTLGQSRDLAFVLLSMAVGMVAGAGLHAMALLVTLVVSAAISLMVRFDAFRPRRTSHVLTLRVGGDTDVEALLAPVLARYTDSCELLSLASAQAGMCNEARYGIQLKPGASRSRLLEELLALTGNNRVVISSAADPETSI
jgi:hypothetical protein